MAAENNESAVVETLGSVVVAKHGNGWVVKYENAFQMDDGKWILKLRVLVAVPRLW